METEDGVAILVLSAAAEAAVEATGNRVVRADADAAQQFRDRGAMIAVVDLADDLPPGLSAAVEAQGGALIAIGDAVRAYAAGATHAAVDVAAVPAAIRFARRHIDRVAHGGERRQAPLWTDPSANAAVAAALDARSATAIAVVALSRLDLANAAHGRSAVDAMLDMVERRIAAALPDATIVRLDGARFAVVIDAGGAAAGAVLGEALAQPFGPGQATSIGLRVGVAECRPGDDAGDLLRRAIDAIVGRKGPDGASLRIATTSVPIDELAVDLHRAIERDEIGLRYQPQVAIDDGRIVGVEALARWLHPVRGELGATALFAAAERADLELALSSHIQRLALTQAAAWPPVLADLRLAVNVTAGDVARSGFATTFLDRVRASGFAADRLTVEITETGLIEDLSAASSLLDGLRAAGCRVAIDDFGTGYSSLAYLTALPLDYLKLDKSLVAGIDGDDRERVVVRGTIAMAKALGLAVIAEGVETRAQRYQLAALGCDLYQGFLFTGAVELPALVDLVKKSRA